MYNIGIPEIIITDRLEDDKHLSIKQKVLRSLFYRSKNDVTGEGGISFRNEEKPPEELFMPYPV